jgi:hypothetical protein
MKTIISILAVVFLAVTPAAAKSAKSFAPGHHSKGVHGASPFAPGQSACTCKVRRCSNLFSVRVTSDTLVASA